MISYNGILEFVEDLSNNICLPFNFYVFYLVFYEEYIIGRL